MVHYVCILLKNRTSISKIGVKVLIDAFKKKARVTSLIEML